VKRIVAYIVLFVVLLYAVREIIYIGIRKNKAGLYDKYQTVFLKQNDYNVLFMGSSRSEMHFNTAIFDSITGMNSFNIGVTGATPRIAFQVLKSYCEKSKAPQFLIFDLDYHFLKFGVDTIRHFPRYFAFLKNETLLNGFNSIDSRFKSFRYNPVHSLPYSNIRLLAASLHGWLDIPSADDQSYHKGFTNVINRDSIFSDSLSPYYSWIHPTERAYIDSVIFFAKSKNIELVLTSSPMFKNVKDAMLNRGQIINNLKFLAANNKVPYFDFSFGSYSYRMGYFVDYYHMNGVGASVFTSEFSLFFQQYFDKNTVK